MWDLVNVKGLFRLFRRDRKAKFTSMSPNSLTVSIRMEETRWNGRRI